MTTIKEWKQIDNEVMSQEYEYFRFMKLCDATLELAPELIRVIELAEEALLGVIRVADRQTSEFDRVHQALSEIRKLKGE